MINFEAIRNEQGNIDLVAAFRQLASLNAGDWQAGERYLEMVMGIFPITSRQAAAVALANALAIAKSEGNLK